MRSRCLLSQNERPVVARRPGELGRARELRSRRGWVRERDRVAEIAARPRRGPLVADLLRKRQRLGRVRLRRSELAHPEGDVGAAFEGACAQRGLAVPAGVQRARVRQLGLCEATARAPPPTERHAEAQGQRGLLRSAWSIAAARLAASGSSASSHSPLAPGLEVRRRLLGEGEVSDRGGGRGPVLPRRPRPAARARTGARSPAGGSGPRSPAPRRSPATCRPASRAGRARARARSPSPAQTSSAASSVKPPANTARRRSSARSSVGEQLVAPVDRGAQRLLARQCGPRPAGEQAEAVVEAAPRSARPTAPAPGRRPARSPAGSRRARADRGHSLGVLGVSAKPGRASARPLDEQLHGLGCGHRPRARPPAATATAPARRPRRRRRAARGSSPGPRPRERPAAAPRRPRRTPRAGARSCRGRAAPGARRGRRRTAWSSVIPGSGAHPERLGDRRADAAARRPAARARPTRRRRGSVEDSAAAWSASRVLPQPPAPVRVSRRWSRAGARPRPALRSRPTKLESWTGRLLGSGRASAGAESRCEARGGRARRPPRRAPGLAGGAGPAPEARALGQALGDEVIGGARDECLAAVGDRPQPRAAVKRRARVVAGVAQQRLAAVEGDPHPKLRAVRPLGGRQAALKIERAGQRTRGLEKATTALSPSPCSIGRTPPAAATERSRSSS